MTTKDEVRSTVETLRTKRALKLALEALEETRNALAWFYDSYPQDVTKKGNELLPHVETVLAAVREALASKSEALASEANHAPTEREQPAQQDYWQEEARRYAQNAEFWRGKYEAATAQQQEPMAIGWQRRDGTLHRGCPPIGEDDGWTPLYTTPPLREWVGLTDDDIAETCSFGEYTTTSTRITLTHVARAIEAKLKEKNV